MLATLLQQYTYDYSTSAELGAGFWVVMVLMIPLWLFYVAAMWRVFTKAGYPGWYSIVPFLNISTLCRIAGRPGWWWVLGIIPCVGSVIMIIVWLDVAKAFGKGTGYGLGLLFLSPIFIPMLGFGSSQYSPSSYNGYYGGGSAPGQPGYGGGGFNGGGGGAFGGGGGGFQQQGGFGPGVGAAPQQPFSSPPQLPSMPGAGSSAPGSGPSSTPPPLPALPSMPGAETSGIEASTAGVATPVPAWTTPGADIPSQVAAPAPVSDGPDAGWYPDPAGGSGLRWWDGSAWTDHQSG
ncbi:MAG: DUF5684 domain-containing protein [Microthrixaceae bacterium]